MCTTCHVRLARLLLKVIRRGRSFKLLELEGDGVLIPYVVIWTQTEDVLGEVDQFLVVWVVIVRNNGHSIVQLEAKRVDRVVHQNHVLQVSVADHAQVLDEYAFVCLEAVLTVQSEVDQGAFRIN